MKATRISRKDRTGLAKLGLLACACVLAFTTAACSSDSEPTSPANGGDNTSQSNGEGTDEDIVNGTIYEPNEPRPMPSGDEFGYVTVTNMGLPRLEAAIAGQEDPRYDDPRYVLLKRGEPLPDSIKEIVNEKYFQEGVEMFARMSELNDPDDFHFAISTFRSNMNALLREIQEASGTFVDVIYDNGLTDELLGGFNRGFTGTIAWTDSYVMDLTQTPEEFVELYEKALAEQGISDYEFWAFKPEMLPPWQADNNELPWDYSVTEWSSWS
ncbi:hypothetical protein SAMN06309944_2022 [Micrococcales bacterium KH10]|nr:hypothetical protein SAMN06309944_2022 [Micrococcales bacterium KH10]